MVKRIKGDLCHDLLVAKTVGKLSFDENNNFTEWQGKTKDKFRELMGIDNIEKNACSLNIDIEEITERESFKQIRFTFESEIGAVVPCYLLVPHKVTGAVPLAITLQGHSTGFHNSIGVAKYENDAQRYDYPRNCFAIQAVNNGFAALCIEQRGMGETGSPRTFGEDVIFTPFRHTCAFTALNAIISNQCAKIQLIHTKGCSECPHRRKQLIDSFHFSLHFRKKKYADRQQKTY